jgi:hypothetical protein
MAKKNSLQAFRRFLTEDLPEIVPYVTRVVFPVLLVMPIMVIVFNEKFRHSIEVSAGFPRSVIVMLGVFFSLAVITAFSTLSKRVFLDYDYDRFSSRNQFRSIHQHTGRDNEKPPEITAVDRYGELAKSSRSLAASLYNRSGVYLIAGVSLAVGGIIAFYLLRPTLKSGTAAIDLFVALLPGSSMLLFVELIAFFFLRQSRAVMDEFRHFDQLARSREELLAALRLTEEVGKPLDVAELMAKGFYFTRGERLAAGETTEIVETRKLEKTEIDLLNRVVELISARKA